MKSQLLLLSLGNHKFPGGNVHDLSEAIVKYRALCPGCGAPISRLMVFRVPALPHCCEHCGCWHRSNAVWEWVADVLTAAAFLMLVWLAWSHRITWTLAAALSAIVFAASYVLFPYITPFVFARPKPNGEPKASA